MRDFIPVLARIIARYLSGAMMSIGLLAPAMGADMARDPELIALIGAAIGVVTESLYALAIKKGWAK